MDGTRTARIAALAAAAVLVVALTAATLLTSHAPDTGRGTAALTERTPVLLRSAEQGTGAVVPRTTPPPTLPAPASSPARTAAAATAPSP